MARTHVLDQWPYRRRRSGKVIRFTVVVAEYEGERYVVSMFSDDTNWVRNVRAADGRAFLTRGRWEAVRAWMRSTAASAVRSCGATWHAPPARQSHIDISPTAPVEDFDQLAPQYRSSVLASSGNFPPDETSSHRL